MGVSTTGGTPLSLDGLFHGKSQSKMDDDWGYPHDSGNHQIIYSYRLYDFSRFSVPFLPVFVAVLSMSGPPEGMTITGSRLWPSNTGVRTRPEVFAEPKIFDVPAAGTVGRAAG